jgi:hypothetical protein
VFEPFAIESSKRSTTGAQREEVPYFRHEFAIERSAGDARITHLMAGTTQQNSVDMFVYTPRINMREQTRRAPCFIRESTHAPARAVPRPFHFVWGSTWLSNRREREQQQELAQDRAARTTPRGAAVWRINCAIAHRTR